MLSHWIRWIWSSFFLKVWIPYLYNFEAVFTDSFVILHFCHFYLCFIRIRMCLTLRRRWSSLQETTWNRNWHLVRSAPSMSTNVCFTCTQTRSSIFCFDIYQICVMCNSMFGKMVWFVNFRDLIFTAFPQNHFIDVKNVSWYFSLQQNFQDIFPKIKLRYWGFSVWFIDMYNFEWELVICSSNSNYLPKLVL